MQKSTHEAPGSNKRHVNLEELQIADPRFQYSNVLGECDSSIPNSYSDAMSFIRVIESIYGKTEEWQPNDAIGCMNDYQLATSIYVKTLSEGIAKSDDLRQFNWRLGAFFKDEAIGRDYVGSVLSVANPKLQSPIHKPVERMLDLFSRNGMAIVQTVKFIESHPELESEASFALRSHLSEASALSIEDETVKFTDKMTDLRVIHELEFGQPNAVIESRQYILSRLGFYRIDSDSAQGNKNNDLGLIRNIKRLEFRPINSIGDDVLETIELGLVADEYHVPRLSVAYIDSSINSALNFLHCLVPSEHTNVGPTAQLIRMLKKIDNEDTLDHSGFIQVTNKLMPLYRKQNLGRVELNPNNVGDLPDAINRITEFAISEAKNKVGSDKIEMYERVANCIFLVAQSAQAGKLKLDSELGRIASGLKKNGVADEERSRIIKGYRSIAYQNAALERANIQI